MSLPAIQKVTAPLVVAGLVVTSACSRGPESSTTTDPVIGGYDAKHPRYDAVGALVNIGPDGATSPFCSATLIASSVVLSAKHCFL